MLENLLKRFGYQLEKIISDEELYHLVLETGEIPFSFEDYEKNAAADPITLNWIMPMFGPGAGGHRTLMRTIYLLDTMGIRSRVYISDIHFALTEEELRHTAEQFYGFPMENVRFYDSPDKMTYAEGVVATSWHTAYVVQGFSNCLSKFYFVQDFEPYFYGVGTQYALAENTYKMGFRGITAGNWLSDVLSSKYHMETQPFGFAYERDTYRVHNKQDDTKRIFFYARPHTERRAFSIGIMALTLLKRQMPEVEIVMAGQDLGNLTTEFAFTDKGILTPEALSETYGQCDLCLVLSLTNLSLLPLEIMASGSVCVINEGANNEWLVDRDNAILTDLVPEHMAQVMIEAITQPEELQKRRERGIAFAGQFTWEQEVKKVEGFLRRSIEKDKRRLER
jgi:glycosyltransferase involved in cell wall biosynthesis